MYRVVSAGWLPDTSDKSYDCVQRLLKRLRECGVIPFEWVVDNIRSTIKPSSWSGLADFVETAQVAYRLDFWAQLPEYVEVMVEKDAVAGTLAPVTREYDVPLHPIRGYNSLTFTWQITRGWDEIEKPITVYYVGDHDPSGRDLERDVRDRLTRHARHPFAWKRLAVEPDPHFDEFSIRPLKAKNRDSRYKKFVAQYGHDCAEVEAIPANDLRDILRAAIESHIPQDRWARLKEIERAEREQWGAFTRQFTGQAGA
jgi:hypothetical protein